MTYFTSDQHFGHENIIRFCQRPFRGAAEMNEVLVEKWNAKVGVVRDDYWPLIMKRSRMLNVSVEVNNYEPVTFDELVANNKKFRDDYAASSLADTTEFFCAEA